MAYTPTTWVEKATKLGPTNLNKLELGVQATAVVADAALPTPGGSNGQFLKKVGGVWVPTTFLASDIPSYPTDATKTLKGDGSWVTPDFVKLYDSTDAAVSFPAASITTSTLPGTYKHLYIVGKARSDLNAVSDYLKVQFNADTTAGNYDFHGANANNAAWNVSTSTSTGVAILSGTLPALTALASSFASFKADIPNYAGTQMKEMLSNYGCTTSGTATTFYLGSYFSLWRVTGTAISTIKFFCNAGNLVTGSRITVYGTN